jgi:phage terminase small subunit
MNILTAKQERFVEEYLIDLNATQAAIRAGYSERTAKSQGQRLLTNVDIAAAIAATKKNRSQRTEITQDYVLTNIVEILERCRQVRPVVRADGSPAMVETEDGELAPAFKFDAANALKAAELLGKHLSMFTDKVDHTSSDGTMSPQQMTEEQVDARLAELEGKRTNDNPTVH